MAQLVEYVDELIQEVGPRPAGTLQEHQAAEMIAARLDDFDMSVEIEEFNCARNIGWVRAVYYALGAAGALLVCFSKIPVLGTILIALGTVFMALDFLDMNPLFSLFKNNLSQNVIARYSPPGGDRMGYTRKVVVMAHYDSPRTMVQAAPPLIRHYSMLRRVIRVSMGILLLLSLLLFIPFPDIVRTILIVLTGVIAAFIALALLVEIINFFMPYNQGANCNGSSVSVLYGVAQLLSSGMDIEGLRNASDKARKRKGYPDEDDERAAGGAWGPQTAWGTKSDMGYKIRQRGGTFDQEDSGGQGKAADAGLMGRIRGAVKKREPQGYPADEGAQDLSNADDQGAQGAQGAYGARGTAPSARAGSAGSFAADDQRPLSLSQRKLRETSVASVGSQLASPLSNPYVTQRPPLAEIEEAKRQREEEAARILEEKRRQMLEKNAQAEQEVPAWYVNAMKKAEKKKIAESDADVVRSRFADVPTQTAGKNLVPTVERVMPGSLVPGSPEKDKTAPTSWIREELEAIPVTAKPDLSGLDRAAFRVLPGGDKEGSRVIVPVDTRVDSNAGAGASAGAERVRVTTATGERAGRVPSESALGARLAPVGREQAPAGREQAPVGREQAPQRGALGGLQGGALSGLPGVARDGAAGGAMGATGGSPDGAPGGATSGMRGGSLGGPTGGTPDDTQRGLQGKPQSGLRSRLRDLPSLSMETSGQMIPIQQATLDEAPVAREELFGSENSLINLTGSFVPLGTTGIMKPLGEELFQYTDKNEIYVTDADDTSISEVYSETGEYSEPELVNIPESRVKSLFGSLGRSSRSDRKKKEKLSNAPSTWLGVDKKYDARKEGRGIATWGNFNEDDEWKGGAYGGKSYRDNARAVKELSKELLDKEVWLVALGAGESKNAGLKSLLEYHGGELKNALFINLLGVGMGDLVFTVSEGNYRPAQTDPRMQSLLANAAQSMAVPMAPIVFGAFATDATAALKEGARAISIMGLRENVPACWRWTDDDASLLREDNLLDATALVVELIKNI